MGIGEGNILHSPIYPEENIKIDNDKEIVIITKIDGDGGIWENKGETEKEKAIILCMVGGYEIF